jgi:hypothetical protein
MKASAALFLATALFFAGCTSTLTARRDPKADLTKLKVVFVQAQLNDNHRIHEYIVQELTALGYSASSGPLTMMPLETDAIVTYQDSWTLDLTTHMIGLNLSLTDNRRHALLAEARYFRPSVTHMEPADMVRLTVRKLFRDG